MRTDVLVSANRELSDRLYSLVESLSSLSELTELDVRHTPESNLVEEALSVLLRHQPADACVVHLERGGRLEEIARHHWADRVALAGAGVPPEPFQPPAELLAAVMASAEPRSAWAREPPASDGDESQLGIALAVPIRGSGGLLGVLTMHDVADDGQAPWQEHALTLFASVLGHLLEQHRLTRQMEATVATRTRQLEAALREAEHLKRRYEQLSNIDELTGLPNRRFFFPEAEAAVARAVRYGHPLSVLLFDIDDFKKVNDAFGHACGDAVLRDVARSFEKVIREGDILARFGGEEFVLVLPNTEIEGAVQLGHRIRHAVRTLDWTFDESALSVTLSIGVTRLEADSSATSAGLLDRLVREADEAMYFCKSHGRDSVATYGGLKPADPT